MAVKTATEHTVKWKISAEKQELMSTARDNGEWPGPRRREGRGGGRGEGSWPLDIGRASNCMRAE